MRYTLLPVLLLAACGGKGDPQSVDDACGTDDYGYDSPSDDAKTGLARANCYRNLMGLSALVLDPDLDTSAQAHADYMLTNRTVTHQESASDDGFTGEWAWDRAEAAGYSWPGGTAISEVVASGYAPDGAVDGWMNSVYHRLVFTTPGVPATGFGQAGTYSSMTLVLDIPDAAAQAVLYPVDGQLEVPTTFNSDEEYPDPAPATNRVGPPITVTVGDSSASASMTDPYGLVLVDASVRGPDGDVEVLTADPGSDPELFNTVMVLPTAPLTAGADYDVEVEVSWSGGDETLQGTFTTAE